MRKAAKSRILDSLHKGFVITCMAVTLGGTFYMGYSYYNYVMYTRPEYQRQKLLAEEELLREGKSTGDSMNILAS